jgi:hypothetical protein
MINKKFFKISVWAPALLCAAVSVLLLTVSCANQGYPSGGPVDKSPPIISKCIPEPNSLNQKGKLAVSCLFSEWIDPRMVEKSVSVFPRPADGFKVRVKGKSLFIASHRELAESTTYHIEIDASLKDLNGVSIGTPFHFVFSTGPVLDSGRVWGCVSGFDVNGPQPKIALFKSDANGFGDTAFYGIPAYLTQTDSSGSFRIDNIRRGIYEIIAFSDMDNNSRLTSAKEQAFAPVSRGFVLDSTTGPIILYPVSSDSSSKRIASLVAVDFAVVMGAWEEGTRTDDSLMSRIAKQLEPFKSGDTVKAVSIEEYIPVSGGKRFFLKLGSFMQPARYLLTYRPQSQFRSGSADTLTDTLLLNGFSKPDTVFPYITYSEPSGKSSLKPRIAVAWSKPVRPVNLSFVLADTAGDSVTCFCSEEYSDTTVFLTERALLPGRFYQMRIPDSSFRDVCGRFVVDTLKKEDTTALPGFVVKFSTVVEEELCYSLSGTSDCPESENRIWRFMPFGVRAVYECPDINGTYRFDSLPAGKGVIGFFIDKDGNGIPASGRLVPWQPPEVSIKLSDTVEARARWDVEGLVSKGCESCKTMRTGKKQSEMKRVKSKQSKK